MIYKSTKTYTTDEGLTCVFRQPLAKSHCRFLHGYALGFKFTFAANRLDEKNWVMDFGNCKPIKEWLKKTFDHTVIVSKDDPKMAAFEALAKEDLIQMVIVPATGCEAVAKFVYESVFAYIVETTGGRVWIESVEVREHGCNSAIFAPTPTMINELLKQWKESKEKAEADAKDAKQGDILKDIKEETVKEEVKEDKTDEKK